MRCNQCGGEVNDKWAFCPSCGYMLEKAKTKDFFEDVFERMEREMKEMNKSFEGNFEAVDLSPFFTKPARGTGFTVKITRSAGGKPTIDVKTFGGADRKEVESEASRLGFRDRIGRALKPAGGNPEEKTRGIRIESAKTTEEPVTSVRRLDGRIVAEIKLPDVKKAEDIELRVLENSIEIRAVAGDKAYFKILTKPQNANVVRREFKKGILTIEL